VLMVEIKRNDIRIIFGRKIDNNKNNEKWIMKKTASDFLNSRMVNRIYSSIGLINLKLPYYWH
jgi:hypothetical protein